MIAEDELLRHGHPRRLLGVFVFDTSAVADARLREFFGAKSLDESVAKLVDLIARARIAFDIEVYMPPVIVEELRRFLLSNGVREETFRELMSWVRIKPPDRHSIRIPAPVVFSYVDEVRKRITKGLRVAEESVRKAYTRGRGSGEAAEEVLGLIIRELREKYREATRKGLLDSIEDLDAVLLALELGAVLVTSDEGVRRFAEALGVTTMDPVSFVHMLSNVRERLRRLALDTSGP